MLTVCTRLPAAGDDHPAGEAGDGVARTRPPSWEGQCHARIVVIGPRGCVGAVQPVVGEHRQTMAHLEGHPVPKFGGTGGGTLFASVRQQSSLAGFRAIFLAADRRRTAAKAGERRLLWSNCGQSDCVSVSLSCRGESAIWPSGEMIRLQKVHHEQGIMSPADGQREPMATFDSIDPADRIGRAFS